MAGNSLFSLRTRAARTHLLEAAGRDHTGPPATLDRLWNGLQPEGLVDSFLTMVASAWTEEALYFYFDGRFRTLHTSSALGKGGPIDRLWEFDVVEVFLRPPHRAEYYEIEISPLGQWLDLKIIEPRRRVDASWQSSLTVAVSVDHSASRWQSALELPWHALACDSPPAHGDVWRINLFRAGGEEPSRVYLSWRPTFTPEPDFHVPSAFGSLLLIDKDVLG